MRGTRGVRAAVGFMRLLPIREPHHAVVVTVNSRGAPQLTIKWANTDGENGAVQHAEMTLEDGAEHINSLACYRSRDYDLAPDEVRRKVTVRPTNVLTKGLEG